MIAWLSQELSLTLLEDGADGRAHVIVGSVADEGFALPEAVARIAGVPPDDASIRDLVERARAGAPGAIDVCVDGFGGRIIAWSEQGGQARVLIAPRGEASVVARRAAAADLAAGVTHEVANALTAIAGWTRMAASGGPLPERTREALEVVQRSARDALGSARGLLRTMRDADRASIIPSSLPDRTDAVAVVRDVLETMRPELEQAGITLETALPTEAWGAPPPAVLRLIVSNLVRNAFEALSDGGRIRVTIRKRADRFVLSISDDGPGMSGPTLAKAFDRYFTTKEEGTGLGLALVRDTIDEAGGRIEVKSRKGVGTRFDVTLPAAGASPLSLRPPHVATVSSGVHPKPLLLDQRVLVVDDDEAMRSMIRTAFEIQGAHVTTARGFEDAVRLNGPFDVALVDLALGDGRGDELIAELRCDHRVPKAILLTGSTDADLDPAGAPDAVLRKPFELDELHRVLESVLESSPIEAEG